MIRYRWYKTYELLRLWVKFVDRSLHTNDVYARVGSAQISHSRSYRAKQQTFLFYLILIFFFYNMEVRLQFLCVCVYTSKQLYSVRSTSNSCSLSLPPRVRYFNIKLVRTYSGDGNMPLSDRLIRNKKFKKKFDFSVINCRNLKSEKYNNEFDHNIIKYLTNVYQY